MATKNAELDTLHHAALRVKDVKRAVEWYKQRFSCEVEYQDETWPTLTCAHLRLALLRENQPPPHIALSAHPAEFGAPKIHRDGTSSVYLKHPHGNNVEILALPHETAPSRKYRETVRPIRA